MSKYLEFKQVPFEGKTKRFEIISINHGDILGRIYWYGAWRQYIFSTTFGTVWNTDCLKDIIDFLHELNMEHSQLLQHIKNIKGKFVFSGKVYQGVGNIYCQCKHPFVAEVDKPTFHRCYRCMKPTTKKQQEFFRK